MNEKPQKYDAIVIGAGPAGSTVATILAKSGKKVLVIEKTKFPRFHIGESLLPASNAIWDRLGVRAELDKNFLKKPGGRWYYDDKFIESNFSDADTYASFKNDAQAYMVERSILDKILIDNSERNGAEILYETTIENIKFKDGQQPTLEIKDSNTKKVSSVSTNCVFDCSGLGAVLSKKLGIRKKNSLNRMAVFAHYKVECLEENLKENWFVGAMIENGWVWTIPLNKEVISIGIVDTVAHYKLAKSNPELYLENMIQKVPYFKHAISMDYERISPVTCMSNVGFTSTQFNGNGWVLIGDAAMFIDPCYSSGVHMALYTAQKAADQFLSLPTNQVVMKEDFKDYAQDLKIHERNVTKLVQSFYDASTNKKLRKWVPNNITPLSYKKFCTVTGGDFHHNKIYTHGLFYLGKLFHKYAPDKNKPMPTNSPALVTSLEKSFRPTGQKLEKTSKLKYALVALFLIGLSGYLYTSFLKKDPNSTYDWNIVYSGDVEIIRSNNSITYNSKTQLQEGDIIQTKDASFIRIQTKAGSSIDLNENTHVTLGKNGLLLSKGNIYADIEKDEIPYFMSYHTSKKHHFFIHGTAFEISKKGKSLASSLSVTEGVVSFQANDVKKSVQLGEFLNTSLSGNLGEIQKIPSKREIAPWQVALNYLNRKEVVFVDNFSSKSLNKNWIIKSGKNGTSQKTKINSAHQFTISGKTQYSLMTPIFHLNKGNLYFIFNFNNISGNNAFDYGFIVYVDGKQLVRQWMNVQRKENGVYYFQEKAINPKGKLVERKIFQTKGLPTFDKTSFKFEYSKQKGADSSHTDKGYSMENIQIEFFIRGMQDSTTAKFEMDSFIVTANKQLTNEIYEKFDSGAYNQN